MKKVIKTKKVVRESIGRELVGASNFASRKSVVKQIVAKYPTPQSLAKEFKLMASKSKDPKAAAKLNELADKCLTTDAVSYPEFVSKVAGLSNLWKIVGGTIGAAALTAGAYWLVSRFSGAMDKVNAEEKAKSDKIDGIQKKIADNRLEKRKMTDGDYSDNPEEYFSGIEDKENVINSLEDELAANRLSGRWDKFKRAMGYTRQAMGDDVKALGRKLDKTPSQYVDAAQRYGKQGYNSIKNKILGWHKSATDAVDSAKEFAKQRKIQMQSLLKNGTIAATDPTTPKQQKIINDEHNKTMNDVYNQLNNTNVGQDNSYDRNANYTTNDDAINDYKGIYG